MDSEIRKHLLNIYKILKMQHKRLNSSERWFLGLKEALKNAPPEVEAELAKAARSVLDREYPESIQDMSELDQLIGELEKQ